MVLGFCLACMGELSIGNRGCYGLRSTDWSPRAFFFLLPGTSTALLVFTIGTTVRDLQVGFHEKMEGKQTVDSIESKEFRKFMAIAGLIDLGYSGSQFI